MDLNRLTEKAQQAVVAAQTLATTRNHAEVTPEHLLVALLEQRGGIVPSVLDKLKIEATQVGADVRKVFESLVVFLSERLVVIS